MKVWIDRACLWLEHLMVLCLVLMALMVFGNVVLRYAFNTGVTVSEELSRWLFVWMIFMGAVIAVKDNAHLGSDSLISRLPPVGKKICVVIGHILMICVCGLVARGAWALMQINWTTTSAVMETSMAFFYASGLLFAVLAAVMLVQRLWQMLTDGQP